MWQLTAGTYWRREGEDIVLVTDRLILRLDSVSARIFELLINSTGIGDEASSSALSDLIRTLYSEGIIERGAISHAPADRHVSHMPLPE